MCGMKSCNMKSCNMKTRQIAAFAISVLTLHVVGAVAVENPGFEDGMAGWKCPPNAVVDTNVFHSGRQSLRLAVKDRKKDDIYVKRQIPVQGGALVEVSCFVKTEDVTPTASEQSFGAGMIVEWMDKAGNWYDSGAFVCGAWGTKDWKRKTCTLRAPEQAGFVLVYLAVHGQGMAWFDDFSLAEVRVPTDKVSPEDGSVVSNNCPRFTWNPVQGARRCQLELSRDLSFEGDSVLKYDVGGRLEFHLEKPIDPGTWYWRVGVAGSQDSQPWSFTQTAPSDQDCLPPLVLTKAQRILSGREDLRIRVKERDPRMAALSFCGVTGECAGPANSEDEYIFVFSPPAGGWPCGFTEGSVEVRDSAGNCDSTTFWLLNAPRPANWTSVEKDGFYCQAGKRIFPLGIYEVFPKYMAEVRAAGWDAVHLYDWERTKDDEACRRYLDSCWENNGLRAFIGFCRGVKSRPGIVQGNFASVARRVGALAAHPGLFCWYLFDEPEFSTQFVAPGLLKEFADLVRALDPYHAVVVSPWPGASAAMSDYRGAWDSCWSQAYGDPAGVARQIDHHRRCLNGSSPITVLVNCNDEEQGKARLRGVKPDPAKFDRDLDHLRACAFLGIVKECNGVFWWWFARDTRENYPASQSPKAWSDLLTVVEELGSVRRFVEAEGPVLTGKVMSGKDCVEWWHKVVDGRTLFIAVNTAAHPVSVSVEVPGEEIRKLDLRRHEVVTEGF